METEENFNKKLFELVEAKKQWYDTEEILKILEVQKGDYISEDDIIRYEDMYGRIK